MFTPPPPRKAQAAVAARKYILMAALSLPFAGIAPAYGWMSSDGGMSLSIGAGNYLLSSQVLKSASGSGKSGKKVKKNPKAYRYSYSSDVSDAFADEFIEKLIAKLKTQGGLDAATEAQIRQSRDWGFVATVREGFQAKSKDPDSIAMAIAFWLATHYGAMHGVDGSGLATADLQDSIEWAMSRDGRLKSATDAEKQRIAEEFLWQSLMQMMVMEAAGDDAQKKQQAAEMARANLQSVGIEPDGLTLDKGGLRLP